LKILQDILHKVHLTGINGVLDKAVSDIQIDSRKVSKGTVFVALKGELSDGHLFIDKAISSGAEAIVCEKMPDKLLPNITYVQVANSHEAAAFMAHNFYDQPSEKLRLVGVTGTNGKTTVVTVLYNLFMSLGYKCGLISTVENKIGNEIIPAVRTTPDAVSLNELLHKMAESGCTHVFMECSSHAIHQHRITGLNFAGALFTNITHDHLDYHKTFEEYLRVKKSFFDHLNSSAFAISNLDDKNGSVMLQNTRAAKHFYSLKTAAEFKGKILENTLSGLEMLMNNKEIHFKLIGEFNAYNLLAAYAAAICLHEDSDEVLRILSMTTGAEGRFDYSVSKKNIIAIVDYAHTPDALKNVLSTIKKLRKGIEQVITVVGCGGDRDKTKRPEMAMEAARLSDRLILTSDNPRSEDPNEIIKEMEAGLDSAGRKKTISITDRKEAIKAAVSFADSGDIILVAGKGHEKYQEIKGVKHHFDDKEVLEEMFTLLEK